VAPPGATIVWHIHDFIGHRKRMAGALRWASSAAAAGVAVSQAIADNARSILSRLPLHVVYNVTDLNQFSPGPRAGAMLDQLAGLEPAADNTMLVVLVATYARWKGQDVFIEAAARASRTAGAAAMRFYIVGGPIYRTGGSQFTEAELRSKAAGLGVGAIVGFIGFQNDPAAIYRAADVVVHASTQPEPFGLTVIEAMACGRATIVVRAGGSAELFTDGTDAVGIPPNNPIALADAILTCAKSEQFRTRLGAAARAAVERRFNPDNLPARVHAVYETLLPSTLQIRT
jgi:glycosyltransferase involved in cell wall biosynthesis